MGGWSSHHDITEILLKTGKTPIEAITKNDFNSVRKLLGIKLCGYTGCYLNLEINKETYKEKLLKPMSVKLAIRGKRCRLYVFIK